MYINKSERIGPDASGTGKRVVRRDKQSGDEKSFSDTFQAVIEVDVVEIGDDSRERARKEQREASSEDHEEAEQHAANAKPATSAGQPTAASLDIKA